MEVRHRAENRFCANRLGLVRIEAFSKPAGELNKPGQRASARGKGLAHQRARQRPCTSNGGWGEVSKCLEAANSSAAALGTCYQP